MNITGIHYHGAHTAFELHNGQCFTDDIKVALQYAGKRGMLAIVELICEATELDAGYDGDSNTAPGDNGEYDGVITFDDVDECGREHKTVRVMTGIEAVKVVAVVTSAWATVLSNACVDVDEWAFIVAEWIEAGADSDDYESHDGDLADYRWWSPL